MRKANGKAMHDFIQKRLEETIMNPHERARAQQKLREAEAIADGIMWLKERIAAIGDFFLKPGLKH